MTTAPRAQSPRERFQALAKELSENPKPVYEMGIPMRDGIELAVDVYFPDRTDGPFPVVLTMTPYDKARLSATEEGKLYQNHGYVFVAVDCRGRGKSEGEWRAMLHDGPDGHDAVEWIAQQPWCNGKIGTTGLSYGGWFQWATAAELPPHLTAMLSLSAAGRWMREIPYTDGCLQLYFGWWVYMVRRRIIEDYGRKRIDWESVLRTLPIEKIGEFINPTGMTWRDVMDQDTLNEFYAPIRFEDQYAKMNYPCLHITGWYDLEDLTGAFHHYEWMMKESPAEAHQYLIAGPWSHGGTRQTHHSYNDLFLGEAAALEMDEQHIRWFDYWLKGIENGVPDDPRVKLWQGGANTWLETDHWPLAEREASLYLRFDGEEGTLQATACEAPEESRSYRYDPLDPVPTGIDVRGYTVQEPAIILNPIEERADVLVYTSAPVTEPIEISGWAHLELFAASDCDDTEWHVRLADVYPDGRSVKVCQGCLRASYRDSLEHPTPLTPGEVTRFLVELWPVEHVFLPGHRLRLDLTSSDFPWFARNLNQFGSLKDQADPKTATNTVHHGAPHASCLLLPVRSGPLPGA